MIKLRKAFVVSLSIVTILVMSGVAVTPVSAAASAGDLVKIDGVSAVYYLSADGYRHVFDHEKTYFTWYDDFTAVDPITQEELENWPRGDNVDVRPGTKLVKSPDESTVYTVEKGGILRSIVSEANAISLYGADWAKKVIDIIPSFMVNYTVGAPLTEGVYPVGTLVKSSSSPDVYYYDGTNYRVFSNEASFVNNRFNFTNVVTVPDTMTITAGGTTISGPEDAIIDTSEGGGGTAPSGSGLTASLASTSKSAGNIPAGSPNEFLTLNLTAASDGDVEVSTIKLSAYDLGTAIYIDNVTFYDAGVKVGTAKNVNSSREAMFNFSTPIKVTAGSTKTLVVKATIEAGQSGNFALGVKTAADITTNGATVSGSFPVVGNSQAIVTGVDIGTVTMSSVGTSDTFNDFGEDHVKLASFNLAAANEPIIWSSMIMKNGGTNTAGIVGNMSVEVDGTVIVSGAELADKFVNFDMGNLIIAKNDTVSVEIYGDLGIANVNNTIDLYFDDANDLVFTGQDFGYGVTIGTAGFGGLNAVSDGIVVTLTAGDVVIDMDKTATPSKDVRPDDNDVVLATIKVVSNGENATITSIGAGNNTFMISDPGSANADINEIENVELKDIETGAVYDITHASSSATATNIGLTLTDDISLKKGVTKTFQLRIDLLGANDTNGVDTNDSFQVTLEDGAFAITGDDSDDDLSNNITPTSVTSAIATVKSASLTWKTTSLATQTIVPGAKNIVIYRASVDTGASSAVTLTSVKISATTTVATAFDDNNVSQLRLYIDGKLAKTVSGQIAEGGSATGYINFTSLNATNSVIAAGKSVVVEVQADFAGTFNPAGYIQLEIDSGTADIIAKDIDNNAVVESVSNVGTQSRTVILASAGTLKVQLRTTEPKANDSSYILASTETRPDKYLAELVLTAANEPVKIKTLVLEEYGSSTDSDIKTVRLYNSAGAMIAEKAPAAAGHVNFDALNITLPADTATSWFIGVTTKSINAASDAEGTGTYGREIQFSLASEGVLTSTFGLLVNQAVTAAGVDTGSDITIIEDANGTLATGEYTGSTTKSMLATTTGSILTSVVNTMADGTLAGGTGKTVAKYKFVFDNGNNRNSDNTELKAQLRQLILTLATSTGASLSNVQAYIEGDSSNKTTAVNIAANSKFTIDLTTLSGTTEKVDGTVTLVIIGDIVTDGTADYMQTEINDLNTDFTYNGNDGNTGMHWTLLSSDLGISDVNGATLSN